MANISEQTLATSTAAALVASNRQGLGVLGLSDTASRQKIIDSIDAFVDAWQEGKRPPKEELDPEDAPFAFGSLWGEQVVQEFDWEWAMLTFHDHGNSKAPGVLSPDRSLAIYPIHFLIGCFQNPRVDCTIALTFNMLKAGKIEKPKPKSYFNLMEGVHRIIPKRIV